jgi:hypothetical protein
MQSFPDARKSPQMRRHCGLFLKQADVGDLANASLPSSRKGEALSGIVTDRSAYLFAIPDSRKRLPG